MKCVTVKDYDTGEMQEVYSFEIVVHEFDDDSIKGISYFLYGYGFDKFDMYGRIVVVGTFDDVHAALQAKHEYEQQLALQDCAALGGV